MSIAKAIEPVWNCIEAARFLRLHPKTVKRIARLGQIPGCRLGRRWFFRPSDLDVLPVTLQLNCGAIGIELSESYIQIALRRLSQKVIVLA